MSLRTLTLVACVGVGTGISWSHAAAAQDIDDLEQVDRERIVREERRSTLYGSDIVHDELHGRVNRYRHLRRDYNLLRPYNFRNRTFNEYRRGLLHRRHHLGTGTDAIYYYNYGPGGGAISY